MHDYFIFYGSLKKEKRGVIDKKKRNLNVWPVARSVSALSNWSCSGCPNTVHESHTRAVLPMVAEKSIPRPCSGGREAGVHLGPRAVQRHPGALLWSRRLRGPAGRVQGTRVARARGSHRQHQRPGQNAVSGSKYRLVVVRSQDERSAEQGITIEELRNTHIRVGVPQATASHPCTLAALFADDNLHHVLVSFEAQFCKCNSETCCTGFPSK